MKPGKNRLILVGFGLVIVCVGLLVGVPYFQERQREYERITRVTVSEAARELPEIAVRLITNHVGIDTAYTITSAQKAPNPEGFFEGPREEIWCIAVDPAVDFWFGPQNNYIAMYVGEIPELLTYDSGWVLYPFRIYERMFAAMGCTNWAD